MANDRLRDALMAARITHEDLAADLGVNAKTVERWLTQARTRTRSSGTASPFWCSATSAGCGRTATHANGGPR